MAENVEALPKPSSPEHTMAERENQHGVAILVALRTQALQVVSVNVTIPEHTPERIDRDATDHGLTRWGLLTHAARSLMAAV